MIISDTTEIDDHEANWGILDQQEALKWVNNFIHVFNGDSNRITLSGCSAGSILLFRRRTDRPRRSDCQV